MKLRSEDVYLARQVGVRLELKLRLVEVVRRFGGRKRGLTVLSDHDEGRNLGGESEIAQRADAEAERNGHAGGKADGNEDHQEENDLRVSELYEGG